MNFNYNDALSAFLILFAVIDILGSIPIIVSLRKKVGNVQRIKQLLSCMVLYLITLVCYTNKQLNSEDSETAHAHCWNRSLLCTIEVTGVMNIAKYTRLRCGA